MNRIKEPSTWAGLGAIFGALAYLPGPQQPYLAGIAAGFGSLAVWLREGKPQ